MSNIDEEAKNNFTIEMRILKLALKDLERIKEEYSDKV